MIKSGTLCYLIGEGGNNQTCTQRVSNITS